MNNLLKASKEILHLHLCEQEGMASGQPTPEQWLKAVDELAEAIEEAEKEGHELLSFVNWHNEKYPDRHIPNCEIGQFNLSEKESEKTKLSAEECSHPESSRQRNNNEPDVCEDCGKKFY